MCPFSDPKLSLIWTLWNKIYLIKTVFESEVLKRRISIDTDSVPLSYSLLSCCGSRNQEELTFIQIGSAQCARTDLNKRFLPKPMTTTG